MTRRERAVIEQQIAALMRRLRDMADHGARPEPGEAAHIRTQIAGLREKLTGGAGRRQGPA